MKIKINEIYRKVICKIPLVKNYKTQYEIHYKRCKLYEEEIYKLQLQNIKLQDINEDLEKKLEKEKNNIKEVKTKELGIPELALKQIEKTMYLTDTYTLKQLTHYLKLDTYEFVKKIAWTINKDNVSEVIAYRDWALQRNEALIKFLEKFAVEKQMFDKIKWE